MSDAVEALVWQTRRLFRELGVAADRALQPLGITAAERALIEFLAREAAPVSMAALARKRAVSRQHIHQTINGLRKQTWIEKRPDPGDARSVLLRLTPEGRALWKDIRAVDRRVLRKIARHVDAFKVRAATETLREVRQALKGDS
jgi:DNA-binding MarR family transcriptional regulator